MSFLYVTLVTEGALIIFFSRQKTAGGAYRSRGAKWGEYGIETVAFANQYNCRVTFFLSGGKHISMFRT